MSLERRWIVVHDMQDVLRVDLPPRAITEPSTVQSESTSELLEVMSSYREAWDRNTLTPQLVDATWQEFWGVPSEAALTVPACNRSQDELAALREQNRGVLLLPDEIMTQEGPDFLLQRFPEIGKSVLRKNKNTHTGGGCIDVEMDREEPNLLAGEVNGAGLNYRIRIQDKQGQRLQTYIVASQFNKLLTGHYFDEEHRVTLPGSIAGSASFMNVKRESTGKLLVGEGHRIGNGYRTEGRKA